MPLFIEFMFIEFIFMGPMFAAIGLFLKVFGAGLTEGLLHLLLEHLLALHLLLINPLRPLW